MGYNSEQIRIDIKGKYTKDYSTKKLIEYVIYEKYKHGSDSKHTGSEVRFYGGYGVTCTDAETMSQDMEKIRKHYKKNSGRTFYHMTISPQQKIPAEILNVVAKKLCKKYFNAYQSVYGIHESTGRPHIHICLNSVSMHDGKKFQVPYPHNSKEYKNFHIGIEKFIAKNLEKAGIIL